MSFRVKLMADATGKWRSLAKKGTDWSERGFAFYLPPDENSLNYAVSSTAGFNQNEFSDHQLVVGEWTHLALVKRGSKLELYVDGALEFVHHDQAERRPATTVRSTLVRAQTTPIQLLRSSMI